VKIDNIILCDAFAQLSEFFKEPTAEFVADVESGRLRSFFEDVFAALEIDAAALEGLSVKGDVYAKLKEDYRKLFIGPLPPYILPVESVYKRWSNDPDCKLSIAAEKGYLMGDPAMDMIKRYQADGVVIPDKYSSMPDHVALELEYMAYLCRNGNVERQRAFYATHLCWMDDLAKDIKKSDISRFYSTGAEITALIVRFTTWRHSA
jgi:TorA maturation chaperone TorD